MDDALANPIDNASKYGIDIELLEYNLTLSYEQRIVQHQAALDLVFELTRAGGGLSKD